jgi:hypothetical protein
MAEKIDWQGTLVAIQPRIRLRRSFAGRSHGHLGYVLRVQGNIGGEEREFLIGVGKAAHTEHQFRAGDVLSGKAQPVTDKKTETAEFFKTSDLNVIQRAAGEVPSPPPWLGVPPDLAVYHERGHLRLDAGTYQNTCINCIWGCRMPVEMLVNPRDYSQKRYRFETFCYGPKCCSLYKAGPTREVVGCQGMVWKEEDWIDQRVTAHRREDE